MGDDNDSVKETEELVKLFQEISLENLPRKKRGKEKGIPWEIRTIKNRIKMFKREKKKVKSKVKKKLIEEKIYKTDDLLIKSRRKLKSEKERKAIEAMNKNPIFFYSIYNRRKNRKKRIGPTERKR